MARVSALNSVDLPTLGRPTIPMDKLTGASLGRRAWGLANGGAARPVAQQPEIELAPGNSAARPGVSDAETVGEACEHDQT